MPREFGIYDHFENATRFNLSLGQMWKGYSWSDNSLTIININLIFYTHKW
jgi:hypothetical protein